MSAIGTNSMMKVGNSRTWNPSAAQVNTIATKSNASSTNAQPTGPSINWAPSVTAATVNARPMRTGVSTGTPNNRDVLSISFNRVGVLPYSDSGRSEPKVRKEPSSQQVVCFELKLRHLRFL